MQLKCNRYIFTYTTPADEIKDFILRADDLANETYGRDVHFARTNQIINQARFLGWDLPSFGANIPYEFTEIPPPGVDHIFENQAKLLVDVAPITRVMLENGKYCPVRMVCGITAAGDLVWKCHLLSGKDGCPYVQRNGKKHRVKTKGTRIVCQTESLPYDDKYLFECFGGETEGVWPMPFLPEFFSDQTIAQMFSLEPGLVEVVRIDEKEPVRVLAKELVPWYRALYVDRTRALTMEEMAEESEPVDRIAGTLVSGWDEVQDNEQFDLDEEDNDQDSFDGPEEDTPQLINITTNLNSIEDKKLKEYNQILQKSGIASKDEAESLREDQKHKERAEKWLLAAINRLRIMSNFEEKIGAVISLVQKHQGQQILILQPRQKWAAKLLTILRKRGFDSELLDPGKQKSQLRRFYEGDLNILITAKARDDLFIEDLTIISVSSFNAPQWINWLHPSHLIYTIVIKQLGYTDYNLVAEHPMIDITIENYTGPGLDILQLEDSTAKPSKKLTSTTNKSKTDKPKKAKKPKFKVKVVGDKGRPKTAASYEKALELAKKFESKDKKCEIYGPESPDVLYTTGMPVQLQGDLN